MLQDGGTVYFKHKPRINSLKCICNQCNRLIIERQIAIKKHVPLSEYVYTQAEIHYFKYILTDPK